MVRADEEAVELLVVGRVDDDRQITGRQHRRQPMGELRPADPAGEGHDPWHAGLSRPGRAGPRRGGRSSPGRRAPGGGR